MHSQTWQPKSELVRGQQELVMVAECLGGSPVLGADATREVLLERLEQAEIVHIGESRDD